MTGEAGGSGNEGQAGWSADEAARRAREDAAWQSIVDHYGESPDVPTLEQPGGGEDRDEHTVVPEPPGSFELAAELGPRSWTPTEDDEGFVPPPAPPVARPHGLRLVAWAGLFGVPAVVLLCIVLHVSLPSPLGFFALVWFVGGFGYLVATMSGPKDPDGGWDDGAVV